MGGVRSRGQKDRSATPALFSSLQLDGKIKLESEKLDGLNICHVRVWVVIEMWPLRKKCDQCGKRIEGQALTRAEMTFCSKEHVAAYFGAYIE